MRRPGPVDEESDRGAGVQALKRHYEGLAAAGDAAGLAALYAADAVRLPPAGEPVVGRDAIRVEWQQLFATFTAISDTGRSSFVVARSEDVAYEIGAYRFSASQADGTPIVREGRYVTTFRRFAAGWRITAEIWQPEPPAGG
ncbi:MAG: YybH family protein [Acidobacteriota bacterium]